MTNKISILTAFLLVSLAFGSTSMAEEPGAHSHYYPFTKVMGDHHLRLVVDHAYGKMALVFEDIAERPVKPVRLDRINAKIVLPDGTVKEQMFRPRTTPGKRYYNNRYGTHSNKRGRYVARGDWIKESSKFDVDVVVPFKGEEHRLTFQYEAPGGELPLHRR